MEDYWLVGESKQECTKEGKWNHNTPSCECKYYDKSLVEWKIKSEPGLKGEFVD